MHDHYLNTRTQTKFAKSFRFLDNKMTTSGIVVRSIVLRSKRATAANVSTIRSFTTKSISLMAKTLINVPSMGDSITEGTIASWTVQVGASVKEGDVVALIETDKVTVDIKAPMDGIITAQFGKSDETVTVGSKLYEIDVDVSTINAANDIGGKPSADIGNTSSLAHTPKPLRIPSIKFLGKDGWSSRKSVSSSPESSIVPDTKTVSVKAPPSLVSSSPKPSSPSKSHSAVTVGGEAIKSTFGRGRISDQEMESLLLGGASTAPNIVRSSNKKQKE